ncbi:Ovule protein [Caenorhabditis elegans]|uniref:Ovule protein n=1 Tax=Caenorhabditis elegans TaxID=6239 RepID=Q9XVT8_CAEEL|nr:Ovule protein [Caenorhabditis elegans]CAB02684.1 Ovule protein [Caenorhabditis elegans]|eukprot:NP_506500.1 Uncharacterized protein CELE_AH10.4 [Caenorhabditis elegans]
MHEGPLEIRFLKLFDFPDFCPSKELQELQQRKKRTCCTTEQFLILKFLIFLKLFTLIKLNLNIPSIPHCQCI